MGNVLEPHKQQQILALGRLGWTLQRIGRATGVHRVTVGEYLRAAGIPVRGRGRPGEGPPKPTISGEVSTDSRFKTGHLTPEVSTDCPRPARASPSASACEPYRELIAEAVGRGRNAVAIYQDLVDDHGFTARYASVRRFVAKLRGADADRGAGRDHDGARRRRPGRLRRRPHGALAGDRQISTDAAVCLHAGVLAQSRCGC